jgi:signal transduction histidine kinase
MEKDNDLSNLTAYSDLIDAEIEIVKEIELNTLTGRRYFEVMVKPFYTGRSKLRGRLIRLTELSRERQLRQLLADQNKQLAAANYSLSKRTRIAADLKRMTVRNQLARELHDQLGHTIIMALSSIDRIEKEKDNEDKWTQLEELMKSVSELLQRSLPEKNGTNGALELKDRIFGVSAILTELQQDSNKAGIRVEFDIQGPAEDVPADHLHDLSQIFRETMTNAVKHGKADKIDYFMMISESGYDVIIADNGNSPEDFQKGFGLTSIEKRVEGLGGTVRFQNENSGFAVFIKIPLSKNKSG